MAKQRRKIVGASASYTIGMGKLVVGVILAAAALAQSVATKQQFLIRIEPARAGFVDTPTKDEQQAMGLHFAYLKRLMSEGKLVLAGPSINGAKTFGIIIVEVENEAEARAILEGDPSYRAGVQKGEVLPFRISLLRDAKSAK
jgi:uncharacterized protein YciI